MRYLSTVRIRTLGIVLAAVVVATGCAEPVDPRSQSPATPIPREPSPSASGSAEVRRAECCVLIGTLQDIRRLQSLSSPFDSTEQAVAGEIYDRANARLSSVGVLVQAASQDARLDSASLEAFGAITSVVAQVNTAALAVNPTRQPGFPAPSAALAIADLALAILTIDAAAKGISCSLLK